MWLWTWQDGLVETLSTFRVAADFCDRYKDFLFCHNEALLYRWVEHHDPALFARISRLVQAGRWHVMGGAYLQPDMNLPSGESHIRQFLYGKGYFADKFGVRPDSAWNIDSFGQSEGFAQILAGCGMKYYIFSRPRPGAWKLPNRVFRWRDRSGSEVLALRYPGSYNTRSKVREKLDALLAAPPQDRDLIFLWGMGDHGGGPSREQYQALTACRRRLPGLIHSTPTAYFEQFDGRTDSLEVVVGELQNASPGCYTSMSRVKQAHREGENLAACAERLAAVAAWRGLADYPKEDLDCAWRQILFAEFHDVLTGTCIPSAERDTLEMFGMCHDSLKRLRTRLLLDLTKGEPPAAEQVSPVFVFNPHSFPAATDLEFTFNHAVTPDPLGTVDYEVRVDGKRVPAQQERGPLNVDHDWTMYTACHLTLPPLAFKRLDVHWHRRPRPRVVKHPKATAGRLRLRSKQLRVVVNPRTGLVDWAGPADSPASYLGKGALRPVVFKDVSHSWWCGSPGNIAKHQAGRFGKSLLPWTRPDGVFRLASGRQAAAICAPPGGRKRIDPLRIIEDGPVRTIVEAIFVYGRSWIIRWYVFSRNLETFEVRDRVFWNERGLMLKLQAPLTFEPAGTVGETPYSAVTRPVPRHSVEQTNQRWVKAFETEAGRWLGVVNSASYAHSLAGSNLYVNVLRSPLYGTSWMAAEVPEREDRYISRQDQGEHEFRFGLLFGAGQSNLPLVRAAGLMNVPPAWINGRPAGPSERTRMAVAPPVLRVAPANVELVALKQAENGKDLIVRLMEHAGRKTACRVEFHSPDGRTTLDIGPYQLKTLRVSRARNGLRIKTVNLVEE